MPNTTSEYINSEKYLFALSISPSPSVFEIIALPPVPNIKPIVPTIISAGIIRLTDAKALPLTTLEINNPSTTPYIEVNIIITIVGNVNLTNFL